MQKILNEKSSTAVENDQKRIKNLYKTLTKTQIAYFMLHLK